MQHFSQKHYASKTAQGAGTVLWSEVADRQSVKTLSITSNGHWDVMIFHRHTSKNTHTLWLATTLPSLTPVEAPLQSARGAAAQVFYKSMTSTRFQFTYMKPSWCLENSSSLVAVTPPPSFTGRVD